MFLVLVGMTPTSATAAGDDTSELRHRIEAMEKDLNSLKQKLDETSKQAESAAKQANAEDEATVKWHLGGYATADYTKTDRTGVEDSFGGGKFNPIFLVSYKDLLLFQGELEVEATSDGETDTQLEYASLDLMATDWLTVGMGKFLTPVGQFQQYLHPTWINKLPDRPAGFVEDGGAEPLSDVGVQLHGAAPIGPTTVTYAVFVGNGPRLAEEGVKLEGFGDDDNSDKAVGGRIGFRPVPEFEIGVSGMQARIDGLQAMAGTSSDADYYLWDVDFAFTKGPWDIRGEYLQSHLGSLSSALTSSDAAPTAIPGTTWRAGYAQVAYRLSGLTSDPVVGNFEPVVRFGRFDVDGFGGFQDAAEKRLTVGLDYWFAPSIVAKLAYERRDFDHQKDSDDVRAQFAYGF